MDMLTTMQYTKEPMLVEMSGELAHFFFLIKYVDLNVIMTILSSPTAILWETEGSRFLVQAISETQSANYLKQCAHKCF